MFVRRWVSSEDGAAKSGEADMCSLHGGDATAPKTAPAPLFLPQAFVCLCSRCLMHGLHQRHLHRSAP